MEGDHGKMSLVAGRVRPQFLMFIMDHQGIHYCPRYHLDGWRALFPSGEAYSKAPRVPSSEIEKGGFEPPLCFALRAGYLADSDVEPRELP
jgi:hypothetical protein